jgi:hypothetical protein
MSSINDGSGPAFPTLFIEPEYGSGYKGMTLRDYFAAQALAGMMARKDSDGWPNHEVAGNCYSYADAMLAARKEAIE